MSISGSGPEGEDGFAFYERWLADGDPADLDRAIELLLRAAAAEPTAATAACLVEALADRIELRADAADLDPLTDWCQWLADSPALEDEDAAHYRGLLAVALMERADASPPGRDADLDAAIGHLQTILAALAPGHPDRPSLLASIADACWQRLNGDASDYRLTDMMTGYARQAWALAPPGEERMLLGVYAMTGIHERLLRPGEPFDLEAVNLAIEILTEIEPQLAGDPDAHLTATVAFGNFLVARAQVTGSVEDLQAATPLLLGAAAEIDTSDPAWAEQTQTLAAAMSTLAGLGMDLDHLDQAVPLLTAACGHPDSNPARAALTRGTLGVLLMQRANFTASWHELDEGIAHLKESHTMAPAGHPYRVATAMNLAGGLLTRFLGRGQAEDVDAARYYLAMTGTLDEAARRDLRDLMADADMVLTGNRGLLGIAESMLGDPAALNGAVASLRAALTRLPPGHPHTGRMRGDLGLALALRAATAEGQPADLEEAARELNAALADMTSAHLMHPIVLLRAGGVLSATAVAAGRQGPLRLAIGYISTALAELDPRFGGRFRFAALLGATALALHRISGDTSDLGEAVSWLEQARSELDTRPFHPQYANCLMQLAQAYRSRGDTAAAHDAALAALRGRARELLVQSGTARSIGFARLAAAEAAQVAAWCFADEKTAAAVEVLELGRGLVLHASTCVAGFADLLADAGREDLAREWREATADIRDTPWDAGIPAQVRLPGLLSGAADLDVPDDLRARALAAMAGSPAELSLLAPPSTAELAAALAKTNADCLIYLLGPDTETQGRAVVVPAAGLDAATAPTGIPLPWLSHKADDVLDGYVSAYAAALAYYQGAPAGKDSGDPPVAWRKALEKLCDWAGPAVMEPILGLTRDWRLGRPARVVLVPAGAMSLVPWHAARYRSGEHGARRYALQDLVVSYAASGRQLRAAAEKDQLPVGASPVVIGDPADALPAARLEAEALVDSLYPAARYLGPGSPGRDRIADGHGTPGEVLAHLPAARRPGASLLHLGCHGVVSGSAPGRSCLLLAGDRELPVDTILRQAIGRPPHDPGGLVSLAACTSDVAMAEYDEALTPATAFLAAGAATAVGARWPVGDVATALLMFMFHYFLTRACSPRDALRNAQLWMLDPGRTAPPEMPPELTGYTRRRSLANVMAWAAFAHQGR